MVKFSRVLLPVSLMSLVFVMSALVAPAQDTEADFDPYPLRLGFLSQTRLVTIALRLPAKPARWSCHGRSSEYRHCISWWCLREEIAEYHDRW